MQAQAAQLSCQTAGIQLPVLVDVPWRIDAFDIKPALPLTASQPGEHPHWTMSIRWVSPYLCCLSPNLSHDCFDMMHPRQPERQQGYEPLSLLRL